ncbi:LysR family transcriptional regulator [Mycolicibacterium litorale]|uniref:Probable hydrogen peroxide-inducible genes activator n=1 Tax=Mycolicibacterium litorale TaxID=758802 RepID=A0A6S6P1J4_9MYCO|nr:LysR family transcriptional regulator [Mycolicibacterium litorale]BCI52295.1 LysR family transcriptional regulator [Mycolicibacterium litorale]
MLGLDRLRALCAVADHGSIAAAARDLHVTPSGVSQQLAKLEREVGAPLLVQVGRGVQLTQAGRLLAHRGEEILSLLAQAQSEVASLDRDVSGELVLSAVVSAGRVVVPEAIAQLRQLHPALSVTFVADDTDDIVPAVVRRDVDLALVEGFSTMPRQLPDEVVYTRIHDDVVDVALPANHPLAHHDIVELAQVTDLPWTTWRTGEVFHTWLMHTLRGRGVQPQIKYEVPEFAAQLEFVARGLAAALVPRLARVWVPGDVALVPVHPRLQREIYAVRRKDNDRPSVRAGMEVLRGIFEAIAASPGS